MSDTLTTNMELELVVEYDYVPGEPEVRYTKNGDGHPGSDEYAEITSVKFGGIEIVDALSEDQLRELGTECLARVKEGDCDGPEDFDDEEPEYHGN